MVSQAWYAALRHRRGNPDTRFAVTYTYCHTLSTRRRHSCTEGHPWVRNGSGVSQTR